MKNGAASDRSKPLVGSCVLLSVSGPFISAQGLRDARLVFGWIIGRSVELLDELLPHGVLDPIQPGRAGHGVDARGDNDAIVELLGREALWYSFPQSAAAAADHPRPTDSTIDTPRSARA